MVAYNIINMAFLGVKKKKNQLLSSISFCLCVYAFNASTKPHLHVLVL